MTRKSFPHRPERANDLLRIIHTDVCGPLRHVSRQGDIYFIIFTDDYSRYGYVYLLKHKHEVFEMFKVFKNKVENQLRKIIKALLSDRGGEYISQEFKDYLKACGIVQQLTPSYTTQHNDMSERRNRTSLDMVDKTPYELWYRKGSNLSYSKFWGCEVTIFTFHMKRKLFVARYAEFFDKNLITQEVSGRAIDLEEIQDKDTSPSEITSEIPMEVKGFEPPQEEVIPICGSKRTHRAPNHLCLNVEVEEHSLGDLNEPASYKAAMFDSESNKGSSIILGIKIYRDRSKRLIGLGQNAYMDKILKRYKMDNSKRGHIPMQERIDLNKTQGASTPKEVKRMQNVHYASAVGSIMYAVRCTRPDVAFVQKITSRFQHNPGELHWTAMKNILKFETDRDDAKSQTGYVFILNGGAMD
nr:hypothetical protein [Tanacetum cinerariifolium]